MKKIIKSTISSVIAASVTLSSAAGLIIAGAEAGDILYRFDASEIESIDNTSASSYGITADTTGTIWGITKQDSSLRESCYYDAVRFSTRSGIGDKTLMTLKFADDTENNPNGITFDGGNFVFETEFSALYKDSGNISMTLAGADGEIATLKMASSSGEYTYTNEAYLIDNSGSQIGNSVKYKGGNDKATGANANAFAANILYFKADIDTENKTYSAWLIQRGTDAQDYGMTEATDEHLLVANQPFNSNAASIDNVSFAVTASSATNGIWLHNIFIKEGEKYVPPSEKTPLERAAEYMKNTYRVTDESYSNITTDLNKPLLASWYDEYTGENVEIAWQSSDTSLIADDGTYTAPEMNPETKTVTMKATLSYGGESEDVYYELTVRKYTNEKLIDSEDFSGKTVINGELEGWELYDADAKVSTIGNVSLGMQNNKLVITKTGVADESDYSERYKAMYRFKEVLSKSANEKTYRTNLRGEYKIVTNFTPGISSSSSQFQLVNIATSAEDAIPARVFPMCIGKPNSTPGVYEYISSSETPEIYKNNVNKTNVTATYYIDTEAGTMSVQINDGAQYTHDAKAGEGLQGMMYIIKSKALAGDTLTVNSIDLYRLSAYDDGTDAVFEASKGLAISDITDTPDAVTSDLNELPTEMDGIKIEWTSSDETLIDKYGVIGERPIDANGKVTLTAKLTKGSASVYKEFYLTVAQETDMQKVLAKAADNLTYGMLTNESVDNITNNLKNLPSTGLYGTSITWKSSDTSVMSDAGKIERLGSKTKLPVTMTATFTKNGETFEKNFDFMIGLDFNAGLTTLYETDFSGSEIADNIAVTNGAGVVSQEDGKLLLTRNASGGSGTSVNIYPTYGGRRINVTGEMIVDADVNLRVGCQKAEVILYDTNGNRITTFYTTGKNNGPEKYTTVYRDSLSGDAVHLQKSVTAGVGLHLKARVHVDLNTGKMTVYTDTDGNGYKAVATDKYIRENAVNLSYIQINAVDDTNGNNTYKNTGVLEVNSVKVSVNEGMIPEMIVNNIDYFSDIISRNGVTAGDLIFPTDKYNGTTVKWTSSMPEVISDTGKYQIENFSENKNVTISFCLSLDSAPEIRVEKSFDMLVLYMDPNNIAIGKTAKSSVIANTGHGAEKAVDGIYTTSWETMRSDDTPALTVDLGEKSVISSIKLAEAEINGDYPVRGYVIEVSQDNKRWTTIYTGETLGAGEKTVSVTPYVAQYVRYRVTEKEVGNSGLSEFGIYLGETDEDIANADLIMLIDKLGVMNGLTSSVELPGVGKYGSKFSYSSSIPDSFSDSGVVSRSEKTINGKLEITASYGNATAEKSVGISVLGKASSSGGGGGGGGGSSSSSSGSSQKNAGTVAALPQMPPQMPQSSQTAGTQSGITTGFNDVPESYWGYSYIEMLRGAGIVSGDDNNNFRPNDYISREEFLKILLGALRIDVSDAGTTEFSDVPKGDWSEPYIAKAVEMGIVQGMSETEFGKGKTITRQDIAVMCTRAMSVVGVKLPTATPAAFTDMLHASDYAVESIGIMTEMGVINGYDDNSFRPVNNATRGEAAKIICGLM